MRTILRNCLVVCPLEWSGLDHVDGVLRYFSEIQGLPFRLWHRDSMDDLSVDDILGKRFDGFIISQPGPRPIMKALARTNKPTVLMNIIDGSLSKRDRNVSSVWIDNLDIGRLGAEHLLSRGDFRSFGFVHLNFEDASGEFFYSREREMSFRETLAAHGKSSESFPPKSQEFSDRELSAWIEALPKPTGIMCVCDEIAVRVLKCCKKARLSVPRQVAVLGVDDVPLLTTGEGRSLSSVHPDFSAVGYRSAEELVRIMNSRKPTHPSEIVVPVTELRQRDSTKFTDKPSLDLTKAMRFIESHARQDLKVRDVARYLGISRRLADIRFMAAHGKTLRGMIKDVRMNKVLSALALPNATVAQVAKDLHFTSVSSLSRIFKRHFGMTITEYRSAQESKSRQSPRTLSHGLS